VKERKAAKVSGGPSPRAKSSGGKSSRGKDRTGRRGDAGARLAAGALPLLERLRPPSRGDLVTVVVLVLICLVVGATYWLNRGGFPAPW
jgi:hypothetical protein